MYEEVNLEFKLNLFTTTTYINTQTHILSTITVKLKVNLEVVNLIFVVLFIDFWLLTFFLCKYYVAMEGE